MKPKLTPKPFSVSVIKPPASPQPVAVPAVKLKPQPVQMVPQESITSVFKPKEEVKQPILVEKPIDPFAS